MNNELGIHYLAVAQRIFRDYKILGEKAISQVSDEGLHWSSDVESNSIAVIMRHLAGNMRSRWTDFLTSDGEKPNRGRDGEFETSNATRAELLLEWERGWEILFSALAALTPDDILKTVYIREKEHTVLEAIERQISHYAYHIGQIVFVAKMLQTSAWETLSIPRKKA